MAPETLDENGLVAWLRTLDPQSRIGDDAAFLPAGRERAVTVDHQIEGVHFVPDLHPAVVAERLLAVNLSDLAAVGATPRWAFLAFAGPPTTDRRALLRSLAAACERHGVELSGGDLARSERLHLSLTLIGERPPRGRWLRREAARPGDGLWLSGTLGESAIGRELVARGARMTPEHSSLPPRLRLDADAGRAALAAVRRHLRPEPATRLGVELGRRRRVAAIDLSDGLSRDLDRLCRASGVGAVVEMDRLPLAPGHEALARALDRDPLRLALHGGEDYVLLFTLPAGARPPRSASVRAIGRIVEGAGAALSLRGRTETLSPEGWDHLG